MIGGSGGDEAVVVGGERGEAFEGGGDLGDGFDRRRGRTGDGGGGVPALTFGRGGWRHVGAFGSERGGVGGELRDVCFCEGADEANRVGAAFFAGYDEVVGADGGEMFKVVPDYFRIRVVRDGFGGLTLEGKGEGTAGRAGESEGLDLVGKGAGEIFEAAFFDLAGSCGVDFALQGGGGWAKDGGGFGGESW